MGQWYSDYLMVKMHEQELLEEARQWRLAKEALKQKSASPVFYQRLLVWLGNWLMNVGCRLASHYEHLLTPTQEATSSNRSS